MANRLEQASSPYLRQHADNPVDWFEWGEEAFAEAERRDVPIFLSVGYASCHWCHVMAPDVAADLQFSPIPWASRPAVLPPLRSSSSHSSPTWEDVGARSLRRVATAGLRRLGSDSAAVLAIRGRSASSPGREQPTHVGGTGRARQPLPSSAPDHDPRQRRRARPLRQVSSGTGHSSAGRRAWEKGPPSMWGLARARAPKSVTESSDGGRMKVRPDGGCAVRAPHSGEVAMARRFSCDPGAC
jgi:hypothetical protein